MYDQPEAQDVTCRHSLLTAGTRSQVVFPGQSLCKLPESGQLRVGPGLETQNDRLWTTKSGILRQTKVGKLWVEGRQKRCVPWL